MYLKVKAKEGFILYKHDETEILAEVKIGEIFKAKLYEFTEEYFAKDSKGREFYVGELDIDGNLKLDECFEIANIFKGKEIIK